MPLIPTTLGIQLVFTLGITNVIFFLLILLSCRCMGILKLTNKLFEYKWYREKFYKLHCYFWWGFILSVILHTVFAFLVFGSPF